MSTELVVLAWTLVLAVVQIVLASSLRTLETGPQYNMGPRDEPGPPVGKITGRLQRAQKNLFETLPLFIAAVLIVHVAGLESEQTAQGCWIYLIARIVYVPLYALGIPVVRTLAFAASAYGLVRVLLPALLST